MVPSTLHASTPAYPRKPRSLVVQPFGPQTRCYAPRTLNYTSDICYYSHYNSLLLQICTTATTAFCYYNLPLQLSVTTIFHYSHYNYLLLQICTKTTTDSLLLQSPTTATTTPATTMPHYSHYRFSATTNLHYNYYRFSATTIPHYSRKHFRQAIPLKNLKVMVPST